ncbi:MAG: arylsulfatase [Nocardioidaceae bacterium]
MTDGEAVPGGGSAKERRVEAEPGFPGTVGRYVSASQPAWTHPDTTSTEHPNVVVIVLDDLGFGQLGCYGSRIATPAIDGLAAEGLRYSNFHVTAMCSPTRSSLLTGRNHHAVGVGYLADFDTGYPSYRGAITPAAATLAEMLGTGGYGTYAVGKWHLTPPAHMSPAGPFGQWPAGRGFDRFYGFLGGEVDQFAPNLWYDQHYVEPPDRAGYHLSEDLVDRSREFIEDHRAVTPERPFFLYLAFGACHAPHQAPRSYRDKYAGVFNRGWDVEREEQLERQIAMGVVPPDTNLAPRNPEVEAWADLSGEERRLFARMQEVFAGFLEHTDAQVGRLVDALREYGVLDNTLLVLLSDNGASGEGGKIGSVNEYRYFLGLPDDLDDNLAALDELGSPTTHNHYPSGWAQAGNTPLKFYKKHTFGGGVRAPLIVRRPGGTTAGGEIRRQFHHVIDVAPTILDVAGVSPPTVYRDVEQMPLHGMSMAYSFSDAAATGKRSAQYFEMGGQRGIWRDGWKAVTYHHAGTPFEDDAWELYDLDSDYSESTDLAAKHPGLVRDLIEAWWQEAERYAVAPLDDRGQERVYGLDPSSALRRDFAIAAGRRLVGPVAGPNFASRSFRLIADLERISPDDEGVLLAYGHRAAGFVFFVQARGLCADFNFAGKHYVLHGESRNLAGSKRLELALSHEQRYAAVDLLVDGTVVGTERLPRSFPGGFGVFTTQCGFNSPSPVSPLYEAPFAFTGGLRQVRVELGEQRGDHGAVAWRAAHMHE